MAPSDLREVASNKADDTGAKKLRRFVFQPHLQGSSVSVDAKGARIFVVDPDNGTLSMVTRKAMKVSKRVDVCKQPEQVLVAPNGGLFVSCRGDGQVLALDGQLNITKKMTLGNEPFGLALTPNGKTLMVTTSSDAMLHALDSTTLATTWSQRMPKHPRGVAVSPDGRKAVVAHVLGISATVVELGSKKRRWAKLPRVRDGWPSELLDNATLEAKKVERKAGGSFAVTMSPGGTRAFVPYMLKNSGEGIDSFVPGCYANGSQLPAAATIAAIDTAKAKVLRPKLIELAPDKWTGRASFQTLNAMGRLGTVRAAVHDPKRSRLFAVGEGSGMMVAFDTSKADPTSAPLRFWELGSPARGIAVGPRGNVAYVHLALDHELAVLDLTRKDKSDPIRKISIGKDELPRLVAKGRKLFHTANDRRLTGITGVSCATCHVDGRSDGVTWLLDGKPLQTPNLSGRDDYHGKVRWAGNSPTLEHSVSEAIKRLQGSGVSKGEVNALAAFIRSGTMEMSKPSNPHSETPLANQGKLVFENANCDSCHTPSKSYSDGKLHKFRGGKFRTPSLRGLFLTAPYYHDGSAVTLSKLLASHEKGNPMAQGKLSKDDRKALEAFLLTL